MNMPGLMMQLSVFPPPRARFQCRLTITAANPDIAFQVQSPPNNANFDNAFVPFARSDGGKSALHELVQTKPSTWVIKLNGVALQLQSSKQLSVCSYDDSGQAHRDRTHTHRKIESPMDKKTSGDRNGDYVVCCRPNEILDHLSIGCA